MPTLQLFAEIAGLMINLC